MFDLKQFIKYTNVLQNKKKVLDLLFESFINMAWQSVLLGSLTSKIKGYHAYRSGMKFGDRLFCTVEPESKQNDNAIVVKSRNDDIVGHVPETLAKKLFNFMRVNRQKLFIVRLLATLDLPLQENGSFEVV